MIVVGQFLLLNGQMSVCVECRIQNNTVYNLDIYVRQILVLSNILLENAITTVSSGSENLRQSHNFRRM